MNRLLLLGWLVSGAAFAHRPYFSEEGNSDLSQAFEVEDPDISMVLYGELTCGADQLWLTFETGVDYSLYIQLGVPEIERLEDFRPSLALLHPSLPNVDEDLPFDVPDGFGVQVWHSEGVDVADEFYEPFTQTSSWVWQEETVTLVEEGRGYLVAWNPTGWTGKAWLAVGTVEDFSGADFSDFGYWNEAVNEFHETDGSEFEDEYCEPVQEPELDAMEDDAGCSSSGSRGPVWGMWAVVLLGLQRRRRE